MSFKQQLKEEYINMESNKDRDNCIRCDFPLKKCKMCDTKVCFYGEHNKLILTRKCHICKEVICINCEIAVTPSLVKRRKVDVCMDCIYGAPVDKNKRLLVSYVSGAVFIDILYENDKIVDKLEQEIIKLKAELNEIKYRPEGLGALEAKKHFEELVKEL